MHFFVLAWARATCGVASPRQCSPPHPPSVWRCRLQVRGALAAQVLTSHWHPLCHCKCATSDTPTVANVTSPYTCIQRVVCIEEQGERDHTQQPYQQLCAAVRLQVNSTSAPYRRQLIGKSAPAVDTMPDKSWPDTIVPPSDIIKQQSNSHCYSIITATAYCYSTITASIYYCYSTIDNSSLHLPVFHCASANKTLLMRLRCWIDNDWRKEIIAFRPKTRSENVCELPTENNVKQTSSVRFEKVVRNLLRKL